MDSLALRSLLFVVVAVQLLTRQCDAEFTVIAREDTALPGIAGTFGNLSHPVISDHGDVAFGASLNGTQGSFDNSAIFYRDSSGLRKVVQENDSNVGLNGAADNNGAFDGSFAAQSNYHMAPDGTLFLFTSLRQTLGVNFDDTGLFAYDGLGLFRIVQENDVLPDGGGRFDSLASSSSPFEVSMSQGGEIAFLDTLRDANSSENVGVYAFDGVDVERVAREGMAAPNSTESFGSFASDSLNISDGGDVTFASDLGFVSNDEAVYRRDSGGLVEVLREGDPVVGSADPLQEFSSVVFSPNGTPVVLGDSGPTSGVNSVMLYNGSSLVEAAAVGDSALVGPTPTLGTPLGVAGVTDGGDILITSTLDNTAFGSNDDEAVYLYDGGLSLIARELDPVPDGNGRLDSFDVLFSESGVVALHADLQDTNGELTGVNDDEAVYYHNGSLEKVLRVNDPVPNSSDVVSDILDVVANDDGDLLIHARLGLTSNTFSDDAFFYFDGDQVQLVVREDDTVAGVFVNSLDTTLSLNATRVAGDNDTIFNSAGQIVISGTDDNFDDFIILFTPGGGTAPADSNGDGIVNTLDINPFVLALTDEAQYAIDFPSVDFLAANDTNGDGVVNTLDINAFVALLTGGGASVPEPCGAALLVLAAVGFLGSRPRGTRLAAA